MPATPLHVGPAMVVKALAGRHFSLSVFVFAQVVMDVEPIVRFLRSDMDLHGFTHTYLGATILGFVALFAGRPLCQWLLRTFQADPHSPLLVWLHGPDHIAWHAAVLGAFVGTYSHVLLDSIMHLDMAPFSPWSAANPLLGVLTLTGIHTLCIATCVAGLALMLLAYAFRGRLRQHSPD